MLSGPHITFPILQHTPWHVRWWADSRSFLTFVCTAAPGVVL